MAVPDCPGANCEGAVNCRTVGAIWSIFSVTSAFALFPATSTADPVTTCPRPFVETFCSEGQVAIPESASVQVNVTATCAVFQPFTGGGTAAATMAGGVLSRLIVAHADAERPMESKTLPHICWLAPSVLTVAGGEQLAMGFVPGAHANVTVTSELFQPAEFGAGLAANEIVGGIGA